MLSSDDVMAGKPKIKSEEREVVEDVPILKFIGNEAVVVFFEGRPEVAAITGKFRKYQTLMFSGESEWIEFGTYEMHHINAYPGFTATIIKEKMTMTDFKETSWILTAEDIKYERP